MLFCAVLLLFVSSAFGGEAGNATTPSAAGNVSESTTPAAASNQTAAVKEDQWSNVLCLKQADGPTSRPDVALLKDASGALTEVLGHWYNYECKDVYAYAFDVKPAVYESIQKQCENQGFDLAQPLSSENRWRVDDKLTEFLKRVRSEEYVSSEGKNGSFTFEHKLEGTGANCTVDGAETPHKFTEDQWATVLCLKHSNSSNSSIPEVALLKNANGTLLEFIGHWYLYDCPAVNAYAFATEAQVYEEVLKQCKEQGFDTAQPLTVTNRFQVGNELTQFINRNRTEEYVSSKGASGAYIFERKDAEKADECVVKV